MQQVSYTWDHGFETYCNPMSQHALRDTLWTAGKAYKMASFGMRAMISLRLDQFFGSCKLKFSPDYTPSETGLERLLT